MDGLMDGRTDGRKDGRTNGRTDGQTDGWMDGSIHRLFKVSVNENFSTLLDFVFFGFLA